MRIGLFGYGSIGRRHFANLWELGEREIRVCDPDPGLLTKSKDVLKLVTEEELWDWKPEVILVCIPPLWHYDLAVQAIERGCHVFCEKPLATNARNAEHLAWLNAQRLNGILAIGYQLRWQTKDFRAEASGSSRVVYTVVQNMALWPSQYEKDVLLEFSHEIDLAHWVKGPVEAVMAKRLGNTWNINLRHLEGYSYVRIVADANESIRSAIDAEGVSWKFDRAKNDQAYKDELAAFLKACRGEGWDERLCSGAEAAHTVGIIEACKESAMHCKVVRL